jgi:hypothetical protein
MSKRRKQGPKRLFREPRPAADMPGLDTEIMERISRWGGDYLVDGARLPLVLPLADITDHSEFDRQVCGAGLKRFVRPFQASDHPVGLPGAHILVQELAPGIRRRAGVRIFGFEELN